MNDVQSGHPDVERLAAFGYGLLAPEAAATVENHIGSCASCRDTLETLPDDRFVSLLRSAAADTPASTMGTTATVPPAARDATAFPTELAGHPRYRLVRKLGEGGMGAVYLAEHRMMQRPVALKLIRTEYLHHPQIVERFRREVRAAARLSHPHIVTAFDAEEAGGTHFLVMEYVEGIPLNDYLEEHGPLPIEEACRYARAAALGLQCAHEQGMVHRDLKPHNLIRARNGAIKILDFGLARIACESGQPAQGQLTGVGVMMGTPDYMAPEQAQDSRTADIRADIYSLGCTLYQLLAGRVPFPVGSAIDKIIKHSADSPQPLGELRPDVPAGLVAVVDCMMAKRPADRFQSPAAVAAALVPFCTPPAAVHSHRARLPGRPLVAAAALLMLAVAAAAVILVIKTSRGEITIKTDHPDIELVARNNGDLVLIRDTRNNQTWDLDTQKLNLGRADTEDGLRVSLEGKDPILLKRRDGQLLVAISRTAAADQERNPGRADSGRAAPPTAPAPKDTVPQVTEAIVRADRRNAPLDSPLVPKPPAQPQRYTNNLGMEFVLVPRGRAWLGGGKGRVARGPITMPYEFYLGVYEVTQGEWVKLMRNNPSYFARTGDGRDAVKDVADADLECFPVENINWDATQQFLTRLNERDRQPGWVYRLPTQREWEYACRGGPMPDAAAGAADFYLARPTNDLLPRQANFANASGLNRTCKVGSFAPNRLGIYDMHGNVWERCADEIPPKPNTRKSSPPTRHVKRGGSWRADADRCRVMANGVGAGGYRGDDTGLRVARVPAALAVVPPGRALEDE